MRSTAKTTSVPPKRSPQARDLLCVGILFCAIAVSFYCIWILDRGFEITDESYYILLAKNTDPSMYYVSAQHWVTSIIWRITGSIYYFRAAGFIILISSAILLSVGSYFSCVKMNLIERDRLSISVIIASAIVGSLFYATTINLSPNYNLLASAAAYSATGLFLIGCNCSLRTIARVVIYSLAGCAIGVEVVCKASSGVSTFAILLVWLGFFERSFLRSIAIALIMTLSALCFVAMLMSANTTFGVAQQSLREGLALFRIVQSEAISVRLVRYALQFWQYFSTSLVAFALPVASCAAYAITGRAIFLKMAIVALVAILFWGGHFIGGWSNGSTLSPPYAVFSMLLMTLSAAFSVWCRDLRSAALFCGLILLPYSVAMGTGNALFTQVVVTLSPWATVAALLAVASYPRKADRNAMAAMTLVFITTLSLQIFTSGDRPYHMAEPLRNQRKSVSLPNLGDVKVDESTAKFLEEVNVAVQKCNIAPGTIFWGLYNIPGLALATDTFPVATPWLNNAEQANFVIERRPDILNQPSVVVLNDEGRGEMPPIPEKLMNSPDGLKLCGTSTFPYANQRIEIWKRG